MDGDLWLASFKGRDKKKIQWTPLTTGPEDDRDPVWMPDNQSILYASNSKGKYDLWLLRLNDKGEVLDKTIFEESSLDDLQPSVAGDHSVVWVKGWNADADLWIKKEGQQAKKLTQKQGAEHSPSFSKDGKKVAYISEVGRSKHLMIHYIGKKDTVLLNSGNPEFPAWSPNGQRLTYTTRGLKGGIWITNPTGRYFNLLSQKTAAATWMPNGRELALSPLSGNYQSYNGDPDWDRLRQFEGRTFDATSLFFLPVPNLPDEETSTLSMNLPAPGQEKWVEHFDQLVHRLKKQYRFDTDEQQKAFDQLVNEYRSKMDKVQQKDESETLLFEFFQKKPFLRKERTGQAAVSSAHPLASETGIEILKKGGNVVDAAIAVSFAIGVVEPDASGIGGYGEMMIYLKGMEAPTCIEFLTRVPEAASLSNRNLNPIPDIDPVKVNIPGTVAGMELAWKKYGSKKVSWADLVAPAIRLAEEGFVLDEAFPTTLAKERANYLRYPGSKALFFKDNKPLQPGDLFKNPDLANTLKLIAKGGAKAFYEGEIAKKMLADLRSYGNVMTAEDLARYYAVERAPVYTTYRGHAVYSGPPPVIGGAILASRLNTLEQWHGEKAQFQEDQASVHALIEAAKLAPSGRNKIADPGLWPVDLDFFTDKKNAQRSWNSCFNPLAASWPDTACANQSTSAIWGDEDVLKKKTSTGTTAFTVADAEGNMVSVTQTLGTWGGTFHVTPGLGFLYNDKLGSYSSNSQSYNARIPFARNVTSISPTLIFKKEGEKEKPFLAVGAAGNAWIGSAVYQIIAGVIDQGLSPQQAIEQPRFLVGIRRAPGPAGPPIEIKVLMENALAPGVVEQLRSMGHDIELISEWGELRMGYSAAILIKDGAVVAGGDPRRSGEARVVKK